MLHGSYDYGCNPAAKLDREECGLCDGVGRIELGDAGGGCIITEKCPNCGGSGYEPTVEDEDDADREAMASMKEDR